MKQEDFDRLKSVCEKEGFELLNLNHEDNDKYFVIAKKIPERVNVEFIASGGISSRYSFSFKISQTGNKHHAGEFMASKLEKYLNGEIK